MIARATLARPLCGGRPGKYCRITGKYCLAGPRLGRQQAGPMGEKIAEPAAHVGPVLDVIVDLL